SDTATITFDASGTTGEVSLIDGKFQYDPNGQFEHLAVGETATDTFTYTVSDGTAEPITKTVTVTINGANDAPVVSDIATSTSEDNSVLIEPVFSDADSSDTHTIIFDASGTTGEVSLADGKFRYDPNGQFEQLAVGETATDTFTYTVDDGNGGIVTKTATVTINGANDAPIVSDIVTSTSEDNSVLIEPAFSDADSSDTHTITFDASGTTGEVSLVDGKFQYDPNDQFEHLAVGETATDTFTYTVDDGNGGVVTKTATITINGANDTPIVSDIVTSTSEDNSVLIEPEFSDADSSDTHSITFDASGTTGEVSLVDGKFQYDPNDQFEHLAVGETATDTFTYTVDDGNGGVVTKTATITINGANDAPVFAAKTQNAPEPVKFAASDGEKNDDLGLSVSVNSSGTVVAGARHGDGNEKNSGAVYVYRPDGHGGVQEVKLIASDGTEYENFGYATAINDSGLVVVGAKSSVYVYQPDGSGNYSEVKIPGNSYSFGYAVAVSNSGLIIVGEQYNKPGGDLQVAGAAFAYVPNGFGGYSEIELTSATLSANDNFGRSVEVNDAGIIVVGASTSIASYPTGQGGEFNSAGYVSVFVPDSSGGYSEVKLTASDRADDDHFGDAIAINENGLIVVGARNNDDLGNNSGSAYIYTPDGEGGYSETKLTASDGTQNDYFGTGVAVNDAGVIVIGAYNDDDNGDKSGSVYAYVPDGFGGYAEYKLTAPDGAVDSYFGFSVAINDVGEITVGAWYENNRAGSVYVFKPDTSGGYSYNEPVQISDALSLVESTGTSPITQSLQLAFTDVDVSDDAHTASITEVSATGVTSGLSSLSDDDLKALLSVTGVTSSASSVEGTIDLTFSAASTVFDYLAAGEQVELVFTVTLDDGNGGVATQPVTVTIVGTNDAPVVSDIAASTSEDDSVLIEPAYIDPDAADTATITFDASGTTGEVSLIDGKFQYDPNGQFEHLAVGETATDTFTYTVSDGTAEPITKTVTVTINGANDAPVVSDIGTSTSEDNSILIEPVFSDVDSSDTHTITFDASGATGEVSLVDGKFWYDPNGQFEHLAVGEIATDTFTYTIDDGNGGVVTKTATITINGTNDAPIVSDIATSTSEDYSVLIEPAFSDADSSDTHTITFDASGTTGEVSLVDGKFQYDPKGQFEYLAVGETATDTFTYTVSDGTAEPVTKTVTVTINGAADAPVIISSEVVSSVTHVVDAQGAAVDGYGSSV
ncbi:VCBS repeat-containing protein, partial [Pseudovibrio ascidiaceicola]